MSYIYFLNVTQGAKLYNRYEALESRGSVYYRSFQIQLRLKIICKII